MKKLLEKIPLVLAALLLQSLAAKGQAYCTPAYTYGCAFGDNIETFNLYGEPGLSILHSTTGCSPSSYGNFTSMSAALYPGTAYSGYFLSTGTHDVNFRIWIDYNDDGVFDATESVYFGSFVAITGPSEWSFSITPAATAPPGTHQMRVRMSRDGYASSMSPCESYEYGETHDYSVQILPLSPLTDCTSGLSAGTIVSDMPGDSLIAGAPVTLTAIGGTIAAGMTYAWGVSYDGGVTFTPLPGVTGTSLYLPSYSPDLCFVHIRMCPSMSGSATTFFCPSSMYFITGYLKTGLGGGCGVNSINKVSITGTTLHNSSVCDTMAGSGIYQEWPNADSFTTTVYKGVPFQLKVSTGNNGSPAQIGAWIDYNHNGAFDAAEFTLIATSSPSNTGASPSALFSTHSITIPSAALTGLTKMRIRTQAASLALFTGADAQSSLPSGETEDYFITILEADSCTTPVVNLGMDTILCPGNTLTLDAGNPGKTHIWNTGSSTQTLVVNSPGLYSVTVAAGACSATDSILVSEAPAPVAGAIFASGDGATYTFVTGGTSGAAGILWLFGDGATSASTTATHTYTADGTYDVSFIATNACGQSDTATGWVTVEGLGVAGAGSRYAGVQVYPNPASGLATIAAKGSTLQRIEVLDNLGKVVRTIKPAAPNTFEWVIDVKSMAQGIYTLRVHTDKGISAVKLVVKD